MTGHSNPPADRSRRLEQVRAEYLVAVEGGAPPDPQASVEQHVDLAGELR